MLSEEFYCLMKMCLARGAHVLRVSITALVRTKSGIDVGLLGEPGITRGRFFKSFNLDQTDPDLEISFSAIQDHVIHLIFMLVFQSNVGLDYSDPDSNCSGLLNLDYLWSKWDYHNVAM